MKRAISLIALILHSPFIFAQEMQQYKEVSIDSYNGGAAVPFNTAIPLHFKIGFMDCKEGFLIEYIPEKETIDNWSEIITFIKAPNYAYSLEEFLSRTKKKFDDSSTKQNSFSCGANQGLETELSTSNGIKCGIYRFDGPHAIPTANFACSTTENEMVAIKALIGNGTLWNIQYTIKYPATATDEEKRAVADKIESYMDRCTVNMEGVVKKSQLPVKLSFVKMSDEEISSLLTSERSRSKKPLPCVGAIEIEGIELERDYIVTQKNCTGVILSMFKVRMGMNGKPLWEVLGEAPQEKIILIMAPLFKGEPILFSLLDMENKRVLAEEEVVPYPIETCGAGSKVSLIMRSADSQRYELLIEGMTPDGDVLFETHCSGKAVQAKFFLDPSGCAKMPLNPEALGMKRGKGSIKITDLSTKEVLTLSFKWGKEAQKQSELVGMP